MTTDEFFPIEDIGLDTPPTLEDEKFWISGDASSTPDGAWASFSPPFIAFGDTTTGNWQARGMSVRDLYYVKSQQTFMVYDADDNYARAASSSMTSSAVVTSSTYTVADGVQTVFVSQTGASEITIELPDIDALLFARRVDITVITWSGAGAIAVHPDTGEQIGGGSTFSFDYNLDSLQIVSDTTPATNNWNPIYYSGHLFRLNYLRAGEATVDIATSASVVTDSVSENTGDAGVTIDGVLVKDSSVDASGGVLTDTVDETTAAAGVTVDGLLIKDGATSAGLQQWQTSAAYPPAHLTTTTGMTTAGGGSGTTLSFLPFHTPKAITVTDVNVEVTTATAASTCRLALYEDASGRPGDLIAESSTLDTTATGVVTWTANTAVAAGAFWTGLRCSSGSLAFRAFANTQVNGLLGSSAGAASLLTLRTGRTETSGAYGAFPATANASTSSTAALPLVTVEA